MQTRLRFIYCRRNPDSCMYTTKDYEEFNQWKYENRIIAIDETVLLAYFQKLLRASAQKGLSKGLKEEEERDMDEQQVIEHLEKKCLSGSLDNDSDGNVTCPVVFDGYLCWPATLRGQLARQPCSGNFLKSTLEGWASRQCTDNATWWIPDGLTAAWSNLTQCGTFFVYTNATALPPALLDPIYPVWLPRIKAVSYFGYAVSVACLVVAICIFVSIKRLHCARNKLHLNLFVSFILRSLLSVLKDGLFVRGTALPQDVFYDDEGQPKFPEDITYSWVCKAIVSIRYYFILANFVFMLMEGLYLHNLMFLKLFSDNHKVHIYCLIGWGLPVFFLVPWIILRTVFEDVICWTEKDNPYITLIFIDVPIGTTVVINFILFLIIVRVLTVKLNSVWIQQRKMKYRKLMKATLILIPLFGVPYSFSLLMSIYTKQSPMLDIIWLLFDQVFSAFQGLFAALVYCLLNSEVQTEIRRKYSSMKDRSDSREFRRSRTISNTQQCSLPVEEAAENLQDFVLDKRNPQEVVINKEQKECYF
ncbi:unnamed protein product [Phaedon cochleariae]|uniref:Parathyroid hormone/parathyroid hormone-related peptide receptor n=1 Tax=Phaedon cochleariae TaxID=80249 RepID=A0A9N9SH66_PHACE|nr:unnamed protein product [Phaedon cochleariae]